MKFEVSLLKTKPTHFPDATPSLGFQSILHFHDAQNTKFTYTIQNENYKTTLTHFHNS